jgi:hypothetical protein
MSILEACVGIICACAPAFPLLVRKLLPGLLTKPSTSTHELETDPPGAPGTKATKLSRNGIGARSEITKTVVHTINLQKSGTESVTELVDSDSRDIGRGNGESASTESHHTHESYKNSW